MPIEAAWAEDTGLVDPTTPVLLLAGVYACVVECPQRVEAPESGKCLRCGRSTATRSAHRAEARSIALWQFGHEPMTGAGCWAELALPLTRCAAGADGAAASALLVQGSCLLRATRQGVCHAIVVWIEFGYPPALCVRTGPTLGNDSSCRLPTFGPTPWQQAALFLEKPIELAIDVTEPAAEAVGGGSGGGSGRGEGVTLEIKLTWI